MVRVHYRPPGGEPGLWMEGVTCLFLHDIGLVRSKSEGRLAQLVRALRSHRRGHWFEPSAAHHPEIPVLSPQAYP